MAGSAGLFQLTVGVKPARKARTGRAPATGELITIVAQPASVDVACSTVGATESRAARGTEGPPLAGRLNPTD